MPHFAYYQNLLDGKQSLFQDVNVSSRPAGDTMREGAFEMWPILSFLIHVENGNEVRGGAFARDGSGTEHRVAQTARYDGSGTFQWLEPFHIGRMRDNSDTFRFERSGGGSVSLENVSMIYQRFRDP